MAEQFIVSNRCTDPASLARVVRMLRLRGTFQSASIINGNIEVRGPTGEVVREDIRTFDPTGGVLWTWKFMENGGQIIGSWDNARWITPSIFKGVVKAIKDCLNPPTQIRI